VGRRLEKLELHERASRRGKKKNLKKNCFDCPPGTGDKATGVLSGKECKDRNDAHDNNCTSFAATQNLNSTIGTSDEKKSPPRALG
jgi:hypothetical protein